MNGITREESKAQIDQAEGALRSRGHTRDELLARSPTELIALIETYGIFLDDPRHDEPKLRGRIQKWPRDRTLAPP
jgi:hypothetical protein